MNKPFSPSVERNKEPILNVLESELKDITQVLEIGSGTGQHACFFGNALVDITWQPTELEENIQGIRMWLEEQALPNVLEPIVMDVNNHPWPVTEADVCFTCNTLHIVNMDSVKSIFKGSRQVLRDRGMLCAYGPFLIDGKHVSKSNEEFDLWLRESDPESGVRDLSELDNIAQGYGFKVARRIDMPANNLMVFWETK